MAGETKHPTSAVFIAAALVGLLIFAVKKMLPPGIRNNNPGNLRPEWPDRYTYQGETGIYHSLTSGDFLIFDTPQNGLRAMGLLILYWYKQGKVTLNQLGLTWSPPKDNKGDTTYGPKLAKRLGVSPDAPFDFVGRLPELMIAISFNENSQFPMDWEPFLKTASHEALLKRGLA